MPVKPSNSESGGRQTRLPADYHLHTVLCRHAEGTPAQLRDAARQKDLPAICFADHMPSLGGYNTAHRMRPDQFPQYTAMVRALQDGHEPPVLFGIEADYYEGCEKPVGEFLAQHDFDLVIGSIHLIGGWVFDDPEERQRWDTVDARSVWRQYFDLLRRAARARLYDIVGHLDIPKKFGHRLEEKLLAELAAPALDEIAKAGMGIEINTGGWRKPVGEQYPALQLLLMAFERRIPIAFGSDAHRPMEVGDNFALALALARQAGYREYLSFRQRRPKRLPLP